MNSTKHAKIRSQQRGIPEDVISLIMQFGTPCKRPGDVCEYRLGKKGKIEAIMHLKYLMQILNKTAGKAILVDESLNTIITVYNVR